MTTEITILPLSGHEYDEGVRFSLGSSKHQLIPVDQLNVNDYSVPIERAERVIQAVCAMCPLNRDNGCDPEFTRQRHLFGLLDGVSISDIRIAGAKVPQPGCLLKFGIIPDKAFRT